MASLMLIVWLVTFAIQATAQCLNTVAPFNPGLRTQTGNLTWFIVPVPSANVQRAVTARYPLDNLRLLDVPVSDTSLFPNGFPAGHHPVVASIGYLADIRLSLLQLDGSLTFALVTVPFVGKGSSNTAIAAPLNGYIGGTDQETLRDFAGLVPSVASGAAFGIDLRFGSNMPGDAAYQFEGSNQFAINNRWNTVPNPFTGPGVYIPALDFSFQGIPQPELYTPKALKAMINQPLLTQGPLKLVGECVRMTYFFGNASAGVGYRKGLVTFGAAASGSGLLPSELQTARPGGVFEGAEGLSGCAQTVAYSPESCESAAKNVNDAAL